MNTSNDKTLDDWRREIDAIDDRIVDLLVARFEIVTAVGQLKTRENIDVVQGVRAEQVKTRVANRAAQKGLDGELVRRLYTAMIDHAHVVEHAIKNNSKTAS